MELSLGDRQTLEARLKARRETLRADIDAHKVHRGDGSTHLLTHRDETDDEAVVNTLDAMEIAGVTRDAEELVVVDAALRRLADGHYGSCTACGADIGLPRLQAAPEAALCLACQTKFERRR